MASLRNGPWMWCALALGFLAVYIWVNSVWVARNGDYLNFDVSSHLNLYLDFRDGLVSAWDAETGLPTKAWATLQLLNFESIHHSHWPNLLYSVATLWACTVGGGEKAPFHSNNLFLVPWVLGTCILMARVSGAGIRRPALWEGVAFALALGLLSPGVYGPLRYYGADFPAASLVVFSLALLVLTRGFSRWGACLAFGVVVGMGSLVKAQFLFYLLLPIGVTVAELWWTGRDGQPSRRERLGRFGRLAVAGALVLVCVYVWLHGGFVDKVTNVFLAAFPHLPGLDDAAVKRVHDEPFERHSWAWWNYYARTALVHASPAVLLALVVAVPGIVAALPETVRRTQWSLLALYAGALVTPLLLTLLPMRDVRYFFPLLSLWPIVASLALMRFKPWIRRSLVAVLVGVSAWSYGVLSFHEPIWQPWQDAYLEHVGREAGSLWTHPPRPAPYPGLTDTLVTILQRRAVEFPTDTLFVAVPFGEPGNRYHPLFDLTHIEAYRLGARAPCLGDSGSGTVPAAGVESLCRRSILDPRWVTKVDPLYASADLLVVLHFPERFERIDPTQLSWADQTMVPIAFANSVPEMIERLPSPFALVAWMHFEDEALEHPMRAYFFYNER